ARLDGQGRRVHRRRRLYRQRVSGVRRNPRERRRQYESHADRPHPWARPDHCREEFLPRTELCPLLLCGTSGQGWRGRRGGGGGGHHPQRSRADAGRTAAFAAGGAAECSPGIDDPDRGFSRWHGADQPSAWRARKSKMTTVLTLLSSPDSAVSDNALKKLATFLGVSCVEAELEQFAEAPPAAGSAVVALSSQTLRQGFVGGVTEADARDFFCRRAAKVLVYGFKASPEDARLLQALTDGAVSGVEPTQNSDRRYAFNRVLDRLEIPLAALSWETRETRKASTFTEAAGGSTLIPLVSLNGKPLLALWRTAGTEFFLLADSGIADIDALVAPSASVRDFYPTLLPA